MTYLMLLVPDLEPYWILSHLERTFGYRPQQKCLSKAHVSVVAIFLVRYLAFKKTSALVDSC